MIEIHNVEQTSPEWFALRCGLPTASMFSAILAKGEGKTRRSYLYKLAAEIITGEPTEPYTNQWLERGQRMEEEARDYYAFFNDVEPARVGFVRNGKKGCSPDSFIGENKILEIKTQRGDLLIETLFKNEFPSEHRAQTQGGLWVCERDKVDICVYWPGMPPFIKEAGRDEGYIRTLSDEVDRFNDELAATVDRIRAYGQKEAA